jgi:hypothetical protein
MREVLEEQMQDTIDLISRALQDAMLDIRFIDQNQAKNPISTEKMRLLTELVMLAMEDIQTKCLQKEQGKHIAAHLRALHDAMNKARYFLNQLERRMDHSSLNFTPSGIGTSFRQRVD